MALNVVDRILKANPSLPIGERRYLEQMRITAMMPYEVMSARPGESLVFRGIGDRKEIEVREKTPSKTLTRWDMLLARITTFRLPALPDVALKHLDAIQCVYSIVDQAPDRVKLRIEYWRVRQCDAVGWI